MPFRDTCSFGKRIEYTIIGDLLMEGFDVYVPLVDDHGVDCIVKKGDGKYVEIQIKARSYQSKQPGCFTVNHHEDAIDNFYFIFCSEQSDRNLMKWVFSSREFVEVSYVYKSGKNKGRRKIVLPTSKKRKSRFCSYELKNYDFLK